MFFLLIEFFFEFSADENSRWKTDFYNDNLGFVLFVTFDHKIIVLQKIRIFILFFMTMSRKENLDTFLPKIWKFPSFGEITCECLAIIKFENVSLGKCKCPGELRKKESFIHSSEGQNKEQNVFITKHQKPFHFFSMGFRKSKMTKILNRIRNWAWKTGLLFNTKPQQFIPFDSNLWALSIEVKFV